MSLAVKGQGLVLYWPPGPNRQQIVIPLFAVGRPLFAWSGYAASLRLFNKLNSE